MKLGLFPHSSSFLVLATIGAGAVHCSLERAEEDRSAKLGSALIGAGEDRADRFAVGVCGSVPNANADAGPVGVCTSKRCSGTLIAPNLVLTARHCLQPTSSDNATYCSNAFTGNPLPPAQTFVTTSDSMAVGTPTWKSVSEVRVPETANNCEDDVALLVLSDVVPDTDARPIDVDVDRNVATNAPSALAIASYGVTNAGFDPDAGYAPVVRDSGQLKRRLLENIPFVCASDVDETCSVVDFTYPPTNVFKLPKSLFLMGPQTIAPADSGSGVLDQASRTANKPTVIGVSTLGTAARDGSTSGGEAVRTSFHKAFLVAGAQAAATKGSYPLPGWAAARTPDAGGPDASPTPCPSTTATPAPTTLGASAPAPSDTTTTRCSSSPSSRPMSVGVLGLVALALAGLVGRRRVRASSSRA